MTNKLNDTMKLAEKLMNATKMQHNDRLLQEINGNKLREVNKQAREQIAAKQIEDSCSRWDKFLEKAKQRESQEQDNRKNLIDSIVNK